MRHSVKTLIIILSLTGGSAWAQQIITLTGKVTEVGKDQPVPFAHVQLKNRSIGTATNIEGEFVFKLPESLSRDTLVISSIGYQTVELPLASAGNSIIVKLQPAVIMLDEVTVKATSALSILQKAVAKIPDNYDTSAIQLTAFYRENLGLDTFQLAYTEAVLDIYKIFKTEKTLNDQIRIVKGRKKQIDFGKDAQFYFWMGGISNGARGSLSDDFVKYNRSEFLPSNPKNYKYYEFDYVGTIDEGGRNLIVIDIVPKKNSRKALLVMKMFIEEESNAIVRINYHLSEAGIRRTGRKDKGLAYSIMTKIVKARLDYHKFEGVVTYKQVDGKWHLNTVTRHWEIFVNSPSRNMVNTQWHADMDFIVTDINRKDVKPVTNNIGDKETPMGRIIGNDLDEAFWENYNILKPVADSVKGIDKRPAPVVPKKASNLIPNRQNGFTRADTLRGKLTPLRTNYDVTFYHLDVEVDMDKRSVKGNNLIRYKVEQPFTKMQVDLYANMNVEKVLYKNKPVRYTREYNAMFITLPEEQKKGTQSEIRIFYEGQPQIPDWSILMYGGVLWEKDSLGNPWAQVVCQGSGASLWWPNKDHQSDEPDSMKIWITVPSGFTEISNGRLKRKTPMPQNKMRYEWEVTYPINNYNVTFSIGKYTHFTDRYISDDTLTIDYYVMPYNLERAKQMFRQVPPMLESFEKNFGKYPFPRDGFTLVESLYPMEHQSGVCIGKITAENSGDTNPLLWHEAAHEWWGNAITTKDIADMWIHEAFATYAEMLVVEHRFGKEAAYNSMIDQVKAVKNEEPMTGVYDVNHIHYDIGDMYSKGSLMLHTFRNVLNNDTLFVNLMRDIQSHFRYRTLSSDELVAYINQRTKTDFTYFFDQYLKYTDLPRLELKLQDNGADLFVSYRWHADVKDFRMPVQVTTAPEQFDFISPTGEWKTMTIKNMSSGEFEVDEDRFYIEVVEQ